LKQETFEDCLKHYQSDFVLGENWSSLADKYGYDNGEELRGAFKNERKKRGIPGKTIKQEKRSKVMRNALEKPRVGIVDIETLPMVCFSWGLFDQNISIEQIVQDSCLLSWAGKFLNEAKVSSAVLSPEQAIKRDSSSIIQSCWDFLSQCDVVIGHNYMNFDSKHINTAFLEHGLPPLKFVIVDTLMVAKQNFKFSSNKLKFINDKLSIRDKIETGGFGLWKKCHEGDPDALKQMLEYNEGDLFSTEELFYKIRPYVRNFNVALYNESNESICPVCGSNKIHDEGHYYTSAGKWASVRCEDCSCVSRRKDNLFSARKKKSLLINS
jgi:hypothetical protein